MHLGRIKGFLLLTEFLAVIDLSGKDLDMPSTNTEKVILRDLGDGLILRRSTRADADELSDFNARIHSDDGPENPDLYVAAWTRDLLEKPHPTCSEGDFTIVEDTRRGKIVSSMNLISQVWAYAGMPFKFGRPELVGTLPEYRHRGLVRAQFDVIHQWSAERGEMVQGITGIPYYYRLFGYEMALNLGGGRAGYWPNVPSLADGQPESYRMRPVVEADLPFLMDLYQKGCRRSLVSCVWNEALWRYELFVKNPQHVNRSEWRIIQDLNGQSVGYLAHSICNWGPMLAAQSYELKEGIPWSAVTPSVVRYLYTTGQAYAGQADKVVGGPTKDFASFGFWLGEEHPAYELMHAGLPRVRPPYAWYLRVVDLPGFLRHLTPVLEQRLAVSPYVGYSGELKLSFYRQGVELKFEDGRLVQIASWEPTPYGHSGDAAFPPLTFLQVLFGYRSLDELSRAFADCIANDLAYGLVNALFPRQTSNVLPIS